MSKHIKIGAQDFSPAPLRRQPTLQERQPEVHARMAESTKAAVDARPVPETEHTFDCNRPFIWCLMPLSSPHAPFAMGVVENL